MSSSCGSVCLLVLLGVVMAFGSPAHLISKELKDIHGSIADVLKLTKPEIGSSPLFTSVMRSINTSCQRKELHLMNVTLDIYMHIFSNILQRRDGTGTPALLAELSSSETSRMVLNLSELQEKMEKLKGQLCHVNHDTEDVLRKLKEIEVDDPAVQKKALAEYKEIYEEASVIISRRCGSHRSS